MVKNTSGGNRTKSKARKDFIKVDNKAKDDLKKIDGQEYALILEIRTAKEMHLLCYDKKQRLGIVRGRLFYKRVRFAKGDIVLVSLRGFEDNTCDILHKYEPEDIRELIKMDELTNSFISEAMTDTEKRSTIASTVIMTMEEVEKVNTDEPIDEIDWLKDDEKTSGMGKELFIGSAKDELNLEDLDNVIDVKYKDKKDRFEKMPEINIDDI